MITFAEALAAGRREVPLRKRVEINKATQPAPVPVSKSIVYRALETKARETFPTITKAAAVDRFMDTPLGQELYGRYLDAPADEPVVKQDTGPMVTPAAERLTALAKELVAKGEAKTQAKAMELAMERNPELYVASQQEAIGQSPE